jgi:cystathionine beta-lyase/cystathionine gamma-synthase
MVKIYGNIATYLIDVTDTSHIKSIFKELQGQTNILLIESCSNPTGKIIDFSIIPSLVELSKEMYFIVDNTWVSSILFNPLDYGADLVVTSLTKYYSGGHCISGAVIGKGQLMKNIYQHAKITGNHISLPYCEIIARQMPQMEQRIKKTSQMTLNIAKFLEKHPKVSNVTHPLLASHPSCQLARIYFGNLGPSVLTFNINFNTKANCMKWLGQSRIIQLQTSFGGKETKFDQWPSRFGKDFKIFQIRLAIGYESQEAEIIRELKELLDTL